MAATGTRRMTTITQTTTATMTAVNLRDRSARLVGGLLWLPDVAVTHLSSPPQCSSDGDRRVHL